MFERRVEWINLNAFLKLAFASRWKDDETHSHTKETTAMELNETEKKTCNAANESKIESMETDYFLFGQVFHWNADDLLSFRSEKAKRARERKKSAHKTK